MIEVTTNGYANGIWQQYLPTNTGPTSAFGSAWVYINSGCVGIGIGNDGNTGATSSTGVTGQWVNLTTLNGVSPANEFIVYTTVAGGADYYVDNAWVSVVPEPASLTLLAIGACAALRRRLRKAM
jgi:PEP-CTERM motif